MTARWPSAKCFYGLFKSYTMTYDNILVAFITKSFFPLIYVYCAGYFIT